MSQSNYDELIIPKIYIQINLFIFGMYMCGIGYIYILKGGVH